MNITQMADIIDRDTLYEVLADWEGRIKDGQVEYGHEALALLYRLLTVEVDREYERERESYRVRYEEAYATWEA